MNELVDKHSRPLNYLRISVTDRCNYRCSYCMPKEIFNNNYKFLRRDDLMTFEENLMVVEALSELGLTKVRLTGGEPLLRKNIEKLVLGIKSVKNIKEGIDHILKYGTMHTDSIITNNKNHAQMFLNEVNSSIAMHNVSTQFADGGEFGFGGEIGISTNKLPPRGPVGINQLTSYKYLVSGKGIIRT